MNKYWYKLNWLFDLIPFSYPSRIYFNFIISFSKKLLSLSLPYRVGFTLCSIFIFVTFIGRFYLIALCTMDQWKFTKRSTEPHLDNSTRAHCTFIHEISVLRIFFHTRSFATLFITILAWFLVKIMESGTGQSFCEVLDASRSN